MTGFIAGEARTQATLFPERLDDYIAEDNPIQVIDVFIEGINLTGLGFKTTPAATGRPAYHPATLPPCHPAKALCLRLSESSTVISSSGKRGWAQC